MFSIFPSLDNVALYKSKYGRLFQLYVGFSLFLAEAKATFDWGLDRFIKEAVLLSSLRHHSIVDVFTAFKANSTAYMVMRLEEGQTLSSLAKSSTTWRTRAMAQARSRLTFRRRLKSVRVFSLPG